jgi:hypothetical protein
MVPDLEVEPVVPVNVTVVVVETGVVEIGKVAVVIPAGTTAVAGTDALKLFALSVTVVPPGPAAPFKVSVPVDETLPRTFEGAIAMPAITAGVTVNAPV